MSDPTGLTYQLKTYEDFMALEADQFNRMCEDFKGWKRAIDVSRAVLERAKFLATEYGIETSEYAIKFPDCFEWVDDGIVGGHAEIYAQDEDGNITHIANLQPDTTQPADAKE